MDECRLPRRPKRAAHHPDLRRVRASTSPRSPASRCRRTIRRTSVRSTARSGSFMVEGAGGPSWFTEYNVLTGLSVRSYGRFAEAVTRLANGPGPARPAQCAAPLRLPHRHHLSLSRRLPRRAQLPDHDRHRELLRCQGARLTRPPDRRLLLRLRTPRARLRASRRSPMFIFVYTSANHFPWDFRYRADRLPRWRPTGNRPISTNICAGRKSAPSDYAALCRAAEAGFSGEPS